MRGGLSCSLFLHLISVDLVKSDNVWVSLTQAKDGDLSVWVVPMREVEVIPPAGAADGG